MIRGGGVEEEKKRRWRGGLEQRRSLSLFSPFIVFSLILLFLHFHYHFPLFSPSSVRWCRRGRQPCTELSMKITGRQKRKPNKKVRWNHISLDVASLFFTCIWYDMICFHSFWLGCLAFQTNCNILHPLHSQLINITESPDRPEGSSKVLIPMKI